MKISTSGFFTTGLAAVCFGGVIEGGRTCLLVAFGAEDSGAARRSAGRFGGGASEALLLLARLEGCCNDDEEGIPGFGFSGAVLGAGFRPSRGARYAGDIPLALWFEEEVEDDGGVASVLDGDCVTLATFATFAAGVGEVIAGEEGALRFSPPDEGGVAATFAVAVEDCGPPSPSPPERIALLSTSFGGGGLRCSSSKPLGALVIWLAPLLKRCVGLLSIFCFWPNS